MPRFELWTSPTRTERATRLRHTPRAVQGTGAALAGLSDAPVHDRRAGVLDVIQAGLLGDAARVGRTDAELEPERGRADRHSFAGDVRAVLGTPEYVEQAVGLTGRTR